MKLSSLRFVQGAVSRKDFVPSMTHFVIEDGHVRAYNGVLTISSPVEFNINCAPKADVLTKAISQCTDVISLSVTPTNRLRIQSGPFKAFIDCVEMVDLPHQFPEGVDVQIDGDQLLLALAALLPFVGDDASRPWTNGVLLRGASALATNNVCLVEYWLGTPFPFVANVPLQAVKEVLRVGESPTHLQLTESTITFHYEDGRWIKTLLYSTEWPDLSRILDVPSSPVPVPEGFFAGLELLRNFTDDQGTVYIDGNKLSTHEQDGIGASVEIEGLQAEGAFKLVMLSKLAEVAQTIDFSAYPRPLMFFGDRVRGAILGYRA